MNGSCFDQFLCFGQSPSRLDGFAMTRLLCPISSFSLLPPQSSPQFQIPEYRNSFLVHVPITCLCLLDLIVSPPPTSLNYHSEVALALSSCVQHM